MTPTNVTRPGRLIEIIIIIIIKIIRRVFDPLTNLSLQHFPLYYGLCQLQRLVMCSYTVSALNFHNQTHLPLSQMQQAARHVRALSAFICPDILPASIGG